MASASQPSPKISVLIPVHNAAEYLEDCLTSLGKSRYDNYECIVVDDASTDDSRAIAARHACRVISLPANSGPAAARNRAVSEATAEILFFIDSDVCLAPDSLERVARRFEEDPELDALIGSYDDQPGHPRFLSQYRNLFHHYVHQTASEEASTFWSGCGAIRRDVLLQYGGFSGAYKRPAIEDIELGYRMRADGRKILLDKQLRVQHLKAWGFRQMVKTDVLDRGIPWTELILRDQRMPSDLNLRISQRISVALVHLLVLAALILAVTFSEAFLGPLLLLAVMAVSNYWFYDATTGEQGLRPMLWFGLALGVSLLASSLWGLGGLISPYLVALVVLFLQHRIAGKRSGMAAKTFTALALLVTAGTAVYIAAHFPTHAAMAVPVALLVAVLSLNMDLYAFLSRRRGPFFSLAAIPFHLLYHFYNGISFTAGAILHLAKKAAPKEKDARQHAATIE